LSPPSWLVSVKDTVFSAAAISLVTVWAACLVSHLASWTRQRDLSVDFRSEFSLACSKGEQC
jgi:hypothetical protein